MVRITPIMKNKNVISSPYTLNAMNMVVEHSVSGPTVSTWTMMNKYTKVTPSKAMLNTRNIFKNSSHLLY